MSLENVTNLFDSCLYCCAKCKGLFHCNNEYLKHQLACTANPFKSTSLYFACERKIFLQLFQPEDFQSDIYNISKDDSFIDQVWKIRLPQDILDPYSFLRASFSSYAQPPISDSGFLLEPGIDHLESDVDLDNPKSSFSEVLPPDQLQNIINKNIDYLRSDDIADLSSANSKDIAFTHSPREPRLLSPFEKSLSFLADGSKSRVNSPFGKSFLQEANVGYQSRSGGGDNSAYASNQSIPFACNLSTDLLGSLASTQDENQQAMQTNIEKCPTLQYLDLAKKDPFFGQNPGLSQINANTKDPFLINATVRSDKLLPSGQKYTTQPTRSCDDLQTSPTFQLQDGNYFSFPSMLDEPTQLDYLDLATLDFLTNPNFVGYGLQKDKYLLEKDDIFSEDHNLNCNQQGIPFNENIDRFDKACTISKHSTDDSVKLAKREIKKLSLKKVKSRVTKKARSCSNFNKDFSLNVKVKPILETLEQELKSSQILKSKQSRSSSDIFKPARTQSEKSYPVSRKRKLSLNQEAGCLKYVHDDIQKSYAERRCYDHTKRIQDSNTILNVKEKLIGYTEEEKNSMTAVIGQNGCVFVKKQKIVSSDWQNEHELSVINKQSGTLVNQLKRTDPHSEIQKLGRPVYRETGEKLTSVLRLKCHECDFNCTSAPQLLQHHNRFHSKSESKKTGFQKSTDPETNIISAADPAFMEHMDTQSLNNAASIYDSVSVNSELTDKQIDILSVGKSVLICQTENQKLTDPMINIVSVDDAGLICHTEDHRLCNLVNNTALFDDPVSVEKNRRPTFPEINTMIVSVAQSSSIDFSGGLNLIDCQIKALSELGESASTEEQKLTDEMTVLPVQDSVSTDKITVDNSTLRDHSVGQILTDPKINPLQMQASMLIETSDGQRVNNSDISITHVGNSNIINQNEVQRLIDSEMNSLSVDEPISRDKTREGDNKNCNSEGKWVPVRMTEGVELMDHHKQQCDNDILKELGEQSLDIVKGQTQEKTPDIECQAVLRQQTKDAELMRQKESEELTMVYRQQGDAEEIKGPCKDHTLCNQLKSNSTELKLNEELKGPSKVFSLSDQSNEDLKRRSKESSLCDQVKGLTKELEHTFCELKEKVYSEVQLTAEELKGHNKELISDIEIKHGEDCSPCKELKGHHGENSCLPYVDIKGQTHSVFEELKVHQNEKMSDKDLHFLGDGSNNSSIEELKQCLQHTAEIKVYCEPNSEQSSVALPNSVISEENIYNNKEFNEKTRRSDKKETANCHESATMTKEYVATKCLDAKKDESSCIQDKPAPKKGNKTGEYLYCNAPGCEFRSIYRRNLTTHRRKHTGYKLLTCDQCTYTTTERNGLKRHIQHSHLKEKRFKCSECEYVSLFRIDVVKHHRNTHIQQKLYACNQCDYRTGYTHSLKFHLMEHAGIRPYKCSACSYQVTNCNKVTRHIRTNHAEEPGTKCHKLDLTFEVDAKQFQCEEMVSDKDIKVIELTDTEMKAIAEKLLQKKDISETTKPSINRNKIKNCDKQPKMVSLLGNIGKVTMNMKKSQIVNKEYEHIDNHNTIAQDRSNNIEHCVNTSLIETVKIPLTSDNMEHYDTAYQCSLCAFMFANLNDICKHLLECCIEKK